MDKKEFIFPGIVLGLVLIIALGLILTQEDTVKTLPAPHTATSTDAGTGTTTVSATTPALSPDSLDTAPGSTGTSHGGSWNSSGPANYYPYGKVTLSFGQAAGFKDGLSIRPLALIEDSRCPADVMCVWAGTVRVTLKLDTAEQQDVTKTIKLNDSITVGGDTITFASVEPMRSKDRAPVQSAYRLTFVVEPTQGGQDARGQCYVGGCSNELCTDSPNQASPCIYKPQFACYREATCERQADGACGWTQTPELSACLADSST